ncbi:MAG: nitrilase-related carbon-nitrogen hydrolase, partial [Bacillota bacterium]|nr:nitrilase-related carbon-nitrogen hydrolase [Bacillota bacterium]
MKDGFIKVAAASPMIKVADTDYNADKVIECIKAANDKGVKLIVFPELTLTGCSCYDLFQHRTILKGAEKALDKVVAATEGMDIMAIVGLPYAVDGMALYSVAAVIYGGELLGLVPRTEVSGTKFQSCGNESGFATAKAVILTSRLVFVHSGIPELKVAVELGNDAKAICAPASKAALNGATVIASLASFPATVYSTDDATADIKFRSKNLMAGFVMAAPGKGESSTDNVFSGLCMIAENGAVLASDEKEDCMVISEIDVEYLSNLRRKSGQFTGIHNPTDSLTVYWGGELTDTVLTRSYRKLPHLPELEKDMGKYCR